MHAHQSSIASVSSMIEFLNAIGVASFSETATVLVKLILVMPATNALRERSYSASRRIKNYLRSTMTQKWMNKEDADNLIKLILLTTFAPEDLTGCQNLDSFQK